MSIFQYTAKDKNGAAVTGTVEAASENEAAEALRTRDIVIISLIPVKKKMFVSGKVKVKADDLVVFSRQLATMIDAGIPLVQSLGILGEQVENLGLKNVILSVRKDIEAGMNFCDALGKHPEIFSELFINMARAGEASGMLDEVLDRLATYMEKTAALNRKIRSSLVYPTVVVTMAIVITTVLLVKVVPTFKGIFETLGGELPLPTRVLIAVSDSLRHNFLLLVGALFVAGFLFRRYIRTEKGRYRFDMFKLKVKVLGVLFTKVCIAKFARTFSTLAKSGVSVLSALDIVAKTSGNKVIEEAVNKCRTSVHSGEPLAAPLLKSGVFPPMVCRMISVGEQTGQLEKMLSKIADFYDEQVDVAVTGLTSMIEPLVISFLGIIIGGIVISLFLPIFKISQLVAR